MPLAEGGEALLKDRKTGSERAEVSRRPRTQAANRVASLSYRRERRPTARTRVHGCLLKSTERTKGI